MGGLGGVRHDVEGEFGAFRQFAQHLGLGPAQHERGDQTAQAVLGLPVAAALDGVAEAFGKTGLVAQEARVGEAHDGPQFGQAVFHRRAGQGQAELRVQLEQGPGALGGGVLHGLGLVCHQGVPVARGKAFAGLLQQGVGDDDHVQGAGPGQQLFPLGLAVDMGVEAGGETPDFRQPVAAHRGGRHHQGGPRRRPGQHHRQGLQGLAQAHVVGQAGAETGLGQAHGPLVAVFLVGAQFGLQGAGQDGLAVLGRAQAFHGSAEIGVAFGIQALQGVGQPAGGEFGQTGAVAGGLGHGGQFRQLGLEAAGQGGIDAVADGDVATLASGGFEQGLERHHQAVVQAGLAFQAEPVLVAGDFHAQPPAVHAHHPYPLALGPVHPGHARQAGQGLHRRQGLFRVLQQPLPVFVRIGLGQERQGVEQGVQVALLDGQVAPGAHGFALDHGDDAGPAGGGFQAGPGFAQRGRHQAQAQPLAHGGQFGAQPWLGGHFPGGDVAVAQHLELPGQALQGLAQRFLGLGGQGEPPAQQLSGPALGLVEAHQAQALGTVAQHADEAQGLGLPVFFGAFEEDPPAGRVGRGGDPQFETVLVPDDLQFRTALGQLGELFRMFGQGHVGMPHQGHDGGGPVDGEGAAGEGVGPQTAGHPGVVGRQLGVAGHAGGADRPGLAPTPGAALLLQGDNVQQAPILLQSQGPDQPAVGLVGGLAGTGPIAGQAAQRGQHVAPTLAATADKEPRRRLAAVQHGARTFQLGEQGRQATLLETLGKTVDVPIQPGPGRRVQTQRLFPQPGRQQHAPEQAQSGRLGPGLGRADECGTIQFGLTGAHRDRMGPASPVAVRRGRLLARLAQAEFARRFQMGRRGPGQQAQGVIPGQGVRQQPLARAHLHLAALEGSLP